LSILARELPEVLHAPVEVTHHRFYSHAKDAPEHALSNVRHYSPDITIIAAHSMAFNRPSVGARLIDVFGWRLGRWLELRIWAADRRARKSRAFARVHRRARRLAHRTIGTATYESVEDTIACYSETIALLAPIEEMQLVILGTFQHVRDGELGPHVRLNDGLAAVAAARRLPWIDRQAIVTGLGADAFQPNGLFSSPLLHRKVADAVLASVAR
jgi:hypothetical protein